MTPNGRFELGKKICLSITGYHPEYWLPAWGIRTVLLGLLGFMTTKANGAIGGIDYTEAERKILAQRSRSWKCTKCELTNIETLPDEIDDNNNNNEKPAAKSNEYDVPQFSFVYEEQKKATSTNANSSNEVNDVNVNSSSSQSPPEIINPENTTTFNEHHQQHHQRQQNETARTSSPRSIYFIDAGIVILISIAIALLAKKLS